MRVPFLLCLALVLSFPSLFAQEKLVDQENALAEMTKQLITSKKLELREEAFVSLEATLTETLQDKNSFAYPFDSLQYLSIQYPQDSSFRIFSWQLYVGPNEYRYGGCIQEKESNKVTFLNDLSKEFMDPEFDQTDADEWYGSVYYRILDFESERGKEYLLFGYNAFKMLEHQKIVDVLSFKNGSPSFGAAAFYQPEASQAEKRRLVYTYSAETSFKLNFDENLDLIIVDNLALGKSIQGTPVWVADGTYFGYKLIDKRWVYEDKLFHEVMSEAPREMPVLDNRKGKDLFGKVNKPVSPSGEKKKKGVKKSKNASPQR